MQKHRTIFAAAVLSALALVASWAVFNAPDDAPAPRTGAGAPDTDPARTSGKTPAADTSRPSGDEATPDDDYDDDDYDEDPFGGERVRMRVQLWDVDADQPLRQAHCESGQGFQVDWDYTDEDNPVRTSSRGGWYRGVDGVTDDNGVIEVKVTRWRIDLPIPSGWALWSSVTAIHGELVEAYTTNSPDPIRVNLRRSADIEIVVQDSEGRPVPNELVRLFWDAQNSSAPLDDARWVVIERGYDRPRRVEDFWSDIEVRAVEISWGMQSLWDEGGREWDGYGLYSPYFSWTNQDGAIHVKGILPDRFKLTVGEDRYSGAIKLVPGQNRRVIELDSPRDNLVNLRVEWHGPEVENPRVMKIGIAAWRHDGRIKPADGTTRTVDGATALVLEDTVTGIPDGQWLVYADGGDVGEGRLIELRGGEERNVTLNVGLAYAATLDLEFVYDGVRLDYPVGELALLHGKSLGLEEDGQGRDPTRTLPPGPYTLRVPGLPPRRIDLRAGEKRKETVRIPAVAVTVSVSAELRRLLAPEDGVVWFSLTETSGNQKSLTFEIDQALEKSEEHEGQTALPHDKEMAPGWRLEFRSPAGTYNWVVVGEGGSEVEGQVTLEAGSAQTLNLDVHNLPGLGVLELSLSGFDDDRRPYVSVKSMASLDLDLPRFSYGGLMPFPAAFSPRVIDAGNNRMLVLAPPGEMVLQVECLTRRRWLQRVVTFPGHARVASSELDYPTSKLEMVSELDASNLRVQVYCEAVGDVPLDMGLNEVPRGRLELTVYRRGGDHYDIAVHVLEVSGDKYELDLDSLEYREVGHAKVNVAFPASANIERDYDGAPQLYALEWLDRRFSGHPVRWSGRGLKREVVGVNPYTVAVVLEGFPPGEYRLIPWESAGVGDWIEFTIEPGQISHVE
jgi:hypothetical protein